MKKLLLVFAITSLFVVSGKAQIIFGAKTGLNIAKVKVDGPDPDSKVGFHFGGLLEYNISSVEGLHAQTELLLSFQGWENQNLTYLNIPIFAKYYVIDQVSLDFGPQVGFLLGGANDATDFFSTADLGLIFGGNYHFTPNINAGLRYVLGLTNIADKDLPGKAANRVFQIVVAYNFNK